MNKDLERKNKSLKSAIEKYNQLKEFIDEYNENHSLNKYIMHVNVSMHNMSESMKQYYEKLIGSYNSGNHEPLLTNLYNRLLDADEHKNKIASELKTMLKIV